MFQKLLFSAIIFSFLFSCTPGIPPIPTITPTNTIIPFSQLQLDNLLIQPNDLPAGVTGAQISNNEERSSIVPVSADYYIQQELAYENNKRGEVMVWIYEDITNTQKRYSDRINALKAECGKTKGQCHPGDPKSISDVGEGGKLIDVYNFIGPDGFTLVFQRCNAVIEINMVAIISEPDGLITYAQRLEKRLKPIVCRE
jgi:hypothetical protein